MNEDDVISFEYLAGQIITLLALIGVVGACALVGLLAGGFFHYLAG